MILWHPQKISSKKHYIEQFLLKKEFTDITQQVIAKENVPEKNTKRL